MTSNWCESDLEVLGVMISGKGGRAKSPSKTKQWTLRQTLTHSVSTHKPRVTNPRQKEHLGSWQCPKEVIRKAHNYREPLYWDNLAQVQEEDGKVSTG